MADTLDIHELHSAFLHTQERYPDEVNPWGTVGDPAMMVKTCRYNGPNDSHCFVGQTLVDLGFTIDEKLEGDSAENVIPAVTGRGITHRAREYASEVQAAADGRVPWGEIDLDGLRASTQDRATPSA